MIGRIGASTPAGTGNTAGAGISTVDICPASGLTCQQIAQSLVGANIIVSNVECRGACLALGTFTSGAGIVGFENGVILSTGSVTDVAGPNESYTTGTQNLLPGDPDLDGLLSDCGVGSCVTNDATVLEFDFEYAAACKGNDVVSFQYVFASDEYHDYLNPSEAVFNDVFAFFLNGANIAIVPGTQSTEV